MNAAQRRASGSLELWTPTPPADSGTVPTAVYSASCCISGHVQSVTDCCWEAGGRYLASVSLDQSCRLFAPVKASTAPAGQWCEIARPQLHGYDLHAVCLLPGAVQHRLVSAAAEKVVRVLLGTDSFCRTLDALTAAAEPSLQPAPAAVSRAVAARQPELGLSNRGLQADDAVQGVAGAEAGDADEEAASGDGEEDSEQPQQPPPALPPLSASVFSSPPSDNELSQLSLWPEVEKLFGHGDEVRCLAASPDGRLLASACTAKTETAAAIVLHSTDSWQCVGRVRGHLSSVSCLRFSHRSDFLLSGSKDRHVVLAALGPAGADGSVLRRVVRLPAHGRIVWSCSWAADDRCFATAGRDRQVKLWAFAAQTMRRQTAASQREGREEEEEEAQASTVAVPHAVLPVFPAAVTALDFSPERVDEEGGILRPRMAYLLAVGCETGSVELWRISAAASAPSGLLDFKSASCLLRLPAWLSPAAAVLRLCFAPLLLAEQSATCDYRLAAASADHTVRVLGVTVSDDEDEGRRTASSRPPTAEEGAG